MVWLDLEGTIIDDLFNCNWLDLTKLDFKETTFGIFTWGWFSPSEIDKELIENIEKKLNAKCVHVITKKECMEYLRLKDKWNWAGEIGMYAEESFNEKFNKGSAFIELMKKDYAFLMGTNEELVMPKVNILYDDTIADNCEISFPDYGTKVVLKKVS